MHVFFTDASKKGFLRLTDKGTTREREFLMICIINNVWPGKLRLREHDCLPAVHLVNDKKKERRTGSNLLLYLY